MRMNGNTTQKSLSLHFLWLENRDRAAKQSPPLNKYIITFNYVVPAGVITVCNVFIEVITQGDKPHLCGVANYIGNAPIRIFLYVLCKTR